MQCVERLCHLAHLNLYGLLFSSPFPLMGETSHVFTLIQLADLVAYAVFRHFEHGDSQYFDLIKDRFDSEGGVEYGLHVVNRA